MSEPEITIQKPKRGKPEITLEERIKSAYDKFMSETSEDVERVVIDELVADFDKLMLQEANLERDWHDSGWKFNSYNSTPLAKEFQARVRDAAARLIEEIDFSKVTLTTAQVHAVKAAYQNELRQNIENAARELAREDARRVAAKVLDIEVD